MHVCTLQGSATVSPALELSDESYVPPPLHWTRLQACRSKRPPKVTLPARVVPDVSGIRIENRYDERTTPTFGLTLILRKRRSILIPYFTFLLDLASGLSLVLCAYEVHCDLLYKNLHAVIECFTGIWHSKVKSLTMIVKYLLRDVTLDAPKKILLTSSKTQVLRFTDKTHPRPSCFNSPPFHPLWWIFQISSSAPLKFSPFSPSRFLLVCRPRSPIYEHVWRRSHSDYWRREGKWNWWQWCMGLRGASALQQMLDVRTLSQEEIVAFLIICPFKRNGVNKYEGGPFPCLRYLL